jgi:GT2 family glycosyltransferase/glycosyltransferase involved in cell wall biosynthesis/SAM-dependent methyltransferase
MSAFWTSLLEPLLDALAPRRILEIGSDKGTTTLLLLERAEAHGAVLHVIDPKPAFDPEELSREHPESLVFHTALSLDVLPTLERVDLALIDGDHNWHTVLNELRLLERRAREEDGPLPVVALHDVDWPYGRRDLYYDPETIPAEARRPFERRGLRPDSDELVDDGLNPHLANATRPADAHSGVRGAIEDFLAESEGKWKLFEAPGQHGLAVLATAELLERLGPVRKVLRRTSRADFLRGRVEAVERDRIDAEIRRVKATQAAKQAQAARAEGGAKAEAELEEAQRRVKRLTAQRDAAEARESALEDELVRARRKVRLAEEEAEAAQERRARDANRAKRLEGEAEAATAEAKAKAAEADAKAAALRRAEERLAALEREHESLERTLDDAREQADAGRHAAAELRETLEERELEARRLDVQLTSVQAELERAKVEAEVAGAERATLRRRHTELAALHESTLEELSSLDGLPASTKPADTDAREAPALPRTAARASDSLRSETERGALEVFLGEYRPSRRRGPDPCALPFPHDWRDVLRAPGERGDGPTVDVVVCVHNALDDVRHCLWSLLHKGSYPFGLILVNDGSDEETTAYLEQVAAANPKATLIHNTSPPHGYTIAANLGMRAAESDYVVLLNSDTVVTYGWLERIVACGESDERIGILGPLSNAASHQSIPALRDGDGWATNPLPSFLTPDGLARLLDRVSPRSRPRLPFVNGFCYAVKRPVLEAIGYFDEESFPSGYCEENDFSFRAAQAGFELAVADDCYVFHAKSKSYTPQARKPIAKRNYETFLCKHGREPIESLVAQVEADESLSGLRESVAGALAGPDALAEALDAGRDGALSIAFILPGLGDGGSGGSHSVYQEVKGMRRLGLQARILLPAKAWERAVAAYPDAEEVFETFADVEELARQAAGADVISATHFKSVALLAELRARRDDFLPAYYIQDYEPFFAPHGSPSFREALDSYAAIPDCLLFAKTHWLCNVVGERHGRHVAKVEPSIDERLFRPPVAGRGEGEGPLRIAAMVRPRTPRRQPSLTVAVLAELRRRFGEEVELTTFGCHREELTEVKGSQDLLVDHRGVLTRQEVAELLGRSDVFLDMSLYQAFGRTALEAMACECTAVVPRLGGVWEFLDDGVNGLAVDTLEPNPAIEALSELVGDRDRLRGLQQAARRTAGDYSVGRAALSEYLVFADEHSRRFERDQAPA